MSGISHTGHGSGGIAGGDDVLAGLGTLEPRVLKF